VRYGDRYYGWSKLKVFDETQQNRGGQKDVRRKLIFHGKLALVVPFSDRAVPTVWF